MSDPPHDEAQAVDSDDELDDLFDTLKKLKPKQRHEFRGELLT